MRLGLILIYARAFGFVLRSVFAFIFKRKKLNWQQGITHLLSILLCIYKDLLAVKFL